MSASTNLDRLESILADDPDWRNRAQAVYELRDTEGTQAINLLGQALLDENLHVAESAAHYLADRGVDAIPHLLAALDRVDKHALPQMLRALSWIGDSSVLSQVERFIEHPDKEVSSAAIVVFAQMADREQAIPQLIRGLQSPYRWMQERCAEIIAPLQAEEAAPYLREIAIRSDDFTPYSAGRSACIALGKLGASQLDFLLEATYHEDDRIQDNAVYALGEIDHPRVYERLTEVLYQPKHMPASQAIYALERLNPPNLFDLLVPVLDTPGVGMSARTVIGDAGDLRAVPLLMKRLHQRTHNADRGLYQLCHKYWGMKSLELNATKLPEVMAAAKAHPDKRVQLIAIWMLASYGYEYQRLREAWLTTHPDLSGLEVPPAQFEIRDLMVDLLTSDDADIRLAALHTLRTAGDRQTLRAVIERLNDPAVAIAEQALLVLGSIRYIEKTIAFEAVPNLTALVHHKDESLRRNAILHLGSIADEAALKALVQLTSDESFDLRNVAAHALGGAPPSIVVPLLLDLVEHDSSDEVRSSAVFAIHTCLHREVVEPDRIKDVMIKVTREIGSNPKQTYKLREWAVFNLGKLNDESVMPVLFDVIEHSPEWQIRMHAVEMLGGGTDDHRAAERLYSLLAHRDSVVRTVAANRLGYVGTRSKDEVLRSQIVEKLIPKLEDNGKGHLLRPTVAFGAAKSLFFIGTTQALDALHQWEAGIRSGSG